MKKLAGTITFIRDVLIAAVSSLILFVLVVYRPSSSSAEVYQWTDAAGNAVFSDSPPAGVSAQEMKLKENNRTQMESPRRELSKAKGKKAEPDLRDTRDVNVILYETSWCPYCKKAKAYLAATGVSLVEYDIEKDQRKAEEMRSKSGSRSIPVIDVEGTIIRGFAPSAIDAAISAKRRQPN